MAVLFLAFEEPPYCFSEWVCSSTFLPAVYEVSLFPTSSPTFVVACVLDDDYSKQE
jgi:hypothetical protein